MASTQTSKSRSVFLDSSVFMAAAISAKGSARALVVWGLAGRCTIATSPLVFQETERNLAKKYRAALPAVAVFQAAWEKEAVDPPLALVRQVADSGIIALKDAPIVAGALQTQVEYLATYDQRHLLRHHDQILSAFRLQVARPDEILADWGSH